MVYIYINYKKYAGKTKLKGASSKELNFINNCALACVFFIQFKCKHVFFSLEEKRGLRTKSKKNKQTTQHL